MLTNERSALQYYSPTTIFSFGSMIICSGKLGYSVLFVDFKCLTLSQYTVQYCTVQKNRVQYIHNSEVQ